MPDVGSEVKRRKRDRIVIEPGLSCDSLSLKFPDQLALSFLSFSPPLTYIDTYWAPDLNIDAAITTFAMRWLTQRHHITMVPSLDSTVVEEAPYTHSQTISRSIKALHYMESLAIEVHAISSLGKFAINQSVAVLDRRSVDLLSLRVTKALGGARIIAIHVQESIYLAKTRGRAA
ncbi:hypothetical protein PM082_000650 [Marasmius tenuissimus]|nr:hypothetical protein PM082_000650 [Marasmius tenuissimus]